MKNARFWTWANGAYVKLTLKPGQRLSWSRFIREDEGWSESGETWELSRDGLAIILEWYSDGCDCDGRLSNGGDMIASADPFTFEPSPQCAPGEIIMRPDWQDGDQYQRDYQAEAAGY